MSAHAPNQCETSFPIIAYSESAPTQDKVFLSFSKFLSWHRVVEFLPTENEDIARAHSLAAGDARKGPFLNSS